MSKHTNTGLPTGRPTEQKTTCADCEYHHCNGSKNGCGHCQHYCKKKEDHYLAKCYPRQTKGGSVAVHDKCNTSAKGCPSFKQYDWSENVL